MYVCTYIYIYIYIAYMEEASVCSIAGSSTSPQRHFTARILHKCIYSFISLNIYIYIYMYKMYIYNVPALATWLEARPLPKDF